MKLLMWVLGALAAGVVAEEALGWVTPLCRATLRSAAGRLPAAARDRYAEEWQAELLALPGGPITKLAWTLRTCLGARALKSALTPRPPRRPVTAAGRFKGLTDRVGAALLLLAASPALVTVAIAVKATSPGPVLFRQPRVGARGELFSMIKFRSMYVDHGQHLGGLAGWMYAEWNDPRVTPLGRFIRRHSLDELPQLVNVLRGEMSLVGPRPPLPAEVANFALDDSVRMLIKPGLTGLWQISGRSDLTWEESMRLDLRYAENWSVALDLLILWKTATAVLGSEK